MYTIILAVFIRSGPSVTVAVFPGLYICIYTVRVLSSFSRVRLYARKVWYNETDLGRLNIYCPVHWREKERERDAYFPILINVLGQISAPGNGSTNSFHTLLAVANGNFDVDVPASGAASRVIIILIIIRYNGYLDSPHMSHFEFLSWNLLRVFVQFVHTCIAFVREVQRDTQVYLNVQFISTNEFFCFFLVNLLKRTKSIKGSFTSWKLSLRQNAHRTTRSIGSDLTWTSVWILGVDLWAIHESPTFSRFKSRTGVPGKALNVSSIDACVLASP